MRIIRRFMNRNAQFTIIAALLIAAILITSVVITYSIIRDNPIKAAPTVLGAIDEINFAIKQILGFTVGYYGSVLQVTGNVTYARILTQRYLESGLNYIASMHPDWAPIFQMNEEDSIIELRWYTNESSSFGNISVTYDLPGLGISGIEYSTSCELNATILGVDGNYVRILVSKDGGEPLLTLNAENFGFYAYDYNRSLWYTVETTSEPTIQLVDEGAEYTILMPLGIDPSAFIVQITDHRGIMTVASSFTHYTLTFSWNSSLYSTLSHDNIVVEMLQNGTLRWLGQNLDVNGTCAPIPPIPVKCLRVNQTVSGVSHEVPFQVEEWAADYHVPLGISSNASLFLNRHMIVFLVNHTVQEVKIWWDPRDAAVQTRFARTNFYFNDDPSSHTLNNGILTLDLSRESAWWGTKWGVTSTYGHVEARAEFFQINSDVDEDDGHPVYGADASYVIYNGVVRDIVTQEAEWHGGIVNCPNVYAEIVIMLPAKTTYYTYLLRIMFVESLQPRTISGMNIITVKMTVSKSQWVNQWGRTSAENGTSAGMPVESIVSDETKLFYNFSSSQTGWMHHWAQFIKAGKGYGLMFTNSSNRELYVFDNKTSGEKRGALKVTDDKSGGTQYITIEFSPVAISSVSFQTAKEIVWYGAVVLFNNSDPIYDYTNQTGLWVIVEHPPTITVSYEN